MESRQTVKIGIFNRDTGSPEFFTRNDEEYNRISRKFSFYGRLAITLADYLVTSSKKFDNATFYITSKLNTISRNGILGGLMGLINRSELDIGVQPMKIDEEAAEILDFTYPYELSSFTFVTREPDYKPQAYFLLQAYSLPMWLTIFSIMTAISLMYYFIWKEKYPFDKISLHVFAVFLRQSSILRSSSLAEKLLVYSWVVGAMVICLAYESVFLSFLTIPPVRTVKDISQLANAVEKSEFQCAGSSLQSYLLNSKVSNLRIIGRDVKKNNLDILDFLISLFSETSEKNIAYLVNELQAEGFRGGAFISEDHFGEIMAAMQIRKDFCCKKMIDMFVHRLMASGIYFKLQSDATFLNRMKVSLLKPEMDTSRRIITLTDLVPAFVVLLSGYFISFLVFIGEIVLSRRKKGKVLQENKRKGDKRKIRNDNIIKL